MKLCAERRWAAGLYTIGTARRRLSTAYASPYCTKRNRTPIEGQCKLLHRYIVRPHRSNS